MRWNGEFPSRLTAPQTKNLTPPRYFPTFSGGALNVFFVCQKLLANLISNHLENLIRKA